METHNINDKPAFPNDYHPNNDPRSEGMSKRFYAACAAMQGLLSNSLAIDSEFDNICKASFMAADELLKQENE